MKQSELTHETALDLVQRRNNNIKISDKDILLLLAKNTGATRASFATVTEVPLSAANKKAGIEILKVTVQAANLYKSLKEGTNPYLNKIKKDQDVDAFVLSKNWHEHYNESFSLVQNRKKTDEKYLYCLPDSAKSLFLQNGELISRSLVASYQTASDAKKTMGETSTYNVKNDLTHNVICRCYKLDNVVEITALKQTMAV